MKRTSAENFTDEAQAVGADVVPHGVITTEEAETAPRTLLSEWDYHLFNEGSHHRLWEKLGAHLVPGAERRVGQRHRRLERLEPGCAPAGDPRRLRHLGGLRPAGGEGDEVQVPHRLAP